MVFCSVECCGAYSFKEMLEFLNNGSFLSTCFGIGFFFWVFFMGLKGIGRPYCLRFLTVFRVLCSCPVVSVSRLFS